MNEDWTGRGHDDAPLSEAVGRLRAARATAPEPPVPGVVTTDATEPSVADPASTSATRDVGPVDPVAPWDRLGGAEGGATLADDLRGRLADRREATAAARQAAAAYAAIHGHVPGGSEEELEPATRRWALRPRTAIVAVCAMLLLAAGLAAAAAWPRGQVEELALTEAPEVSAEPQPQTGPQPGPTPTPSSATVVVDVVGQVRSPGLVTLPEGSRVFDAVAAAGGATESAELSAVNLARPVLDGEQLRIPAPGEVVAAPASPSGAVDDGGLVDLNTADEATLDTLPGIGPALAARIVAWRTDNGPFASVDELDDVSGIGPAMLAKVRDLVTV